MAVKKASSPSEKKLRANVKRLKAKLERADEKAARWKKRAKKSEAAAASSKARLSKLETKLAKTRRATDQRAPRVTWCGRARRRPNGGCYFEHSFNEHARCQLDRRRTACGSTLAPTDRPVPQIQSRDDRRPDLTARHSPSLFTPLTSPYTTPQ